MSFIGNYLPLTGGTLTGDLLFTDGLYDIGKSGATRPRDGFFSRNVAIGGDISSVGNITMAAGFGFQWSGRTALASPSDGNIRITNAAGTSFGLLQLGGTTASFPAIKRVSARLDARLADDSDYAELRVAALWANGNYGSLSSGYWNNISDGVFRATANSGSAGSSLDVSVSGTIKFRNISNSADATITAGAGTFSAAVTVAGAAVAALTSTATFTSGAGAQVGTLTNAPAAGNPTTWIKIVDNGTTRYIPAW